MVKRRMYNPCPLPAAPLQQRHYHPGQGNNYAAFGSVLLWMIFNFTILAKSSFHPQQNGTKGGQQLQGSDVNDIVSTEQDEDFILGQEVTDIAMSKSRDTVVLSIRMPIAEFAHLEQLCVDSGKTLSEVVRDAVEFYGAAKPVADGTAALPEVVAGVSQASR